MKTTFDPLTHVYTVDGRLVPSVTQILAATGFIDSTWFTAESAARGTAVHARLAEYDRTGVYTCCQEPRWMAAWLKFRAEFKPAAFSAIEQPLYSALGFAGTPDRVLQARGMILDIKTGAIPSWVVYQLAGYAVLCGGPKRWQGLAVQVRPNGTYTTRHFPGPVMARAQRVFLAALTVYQAQHSGG